MCIYFGSRLPSKIHHFVLFIILTLRFKHSAAVWSWKMSFLTNKRHQMCSSSSWDDNSFPLAVLHPIYLPRLNNKYILYSVKSGLHSQEIYWGQFKLSQVTLYMRNGKIKWKVSIDCQTGNPMCDSSVWKLACLWSCIVDLIVFWLAAMTGSNWVSVTLPLGVLSGQCYVSTLQMYYTILAVGYPIWECPHMWE